MRYVVDIDGTICKTKDGNYTASTPLKGRIKKINKLYDEGNEIIYFTSRGNLTGINWGAFTAQQLKAWGCKFHILMDNKPFADVYVGDEAINANDFFK